MRFAVAGIVHESNSFAPTSTRLEDFEVLRGDEILANDADASSTVTGYLRACRAAEVGCVALTVASATPAGPITAEAFAALVDDVVGSLADQGPWDGVLLTLHGAAVTEGQDDADGEILRRVREVVGSSVPVVVTLDMHANVSPAMVQHADVVVVWTTNPHVDAEPRGRRAAEIAIAMARGEVRPTSELRQIPVALNILCQWTDTEPMRSLVAELDAVSSRSGVLVASLAEGYPWSDVPAMGMSAVVVTDDEPQLAGMFADELAATVWARRDEFDASAVPVAEAVRRAMDADRHPVLLLDVGDNIGAGSAGDSVVILQEVLRQQGLDVFASIASPQGVRSCQEAGVGGAVELVVGAGSDAEVGPPVLLSGRVEAVTDGRFEDPSVTHGGRRYFDAGPTALVDIGRGNKVALTTRAMGSYSPVQLTSLGLDPSTFRAIVAKGVNSPLAGYGPVVAEHLFVDTPGCTAADLSGLAYGRRRVPMFPFEPDVRLVD